MVNRSTLTSWPKMPQAVLEHLQVGRSLTGPSVLLMTFFLRLRTYPTNIFRINSEMMIKRNWILILLAIALVSCASTKSEQAKQCTPLSKVDFSKPSKDIMAELDTCMNANKFKQAAEKFYALASTNTEGMNSSHRTTELQQLKNVIKKHHPEAAINALDQGIKRIHKNNEDLCQRIGLFNDNNINVNTIKNKNDRELIEQLDKSFSDNKEWKQSLSELLRCH